MNDLEMVRSLAAEPTGESVSRTWHRLVRLQSVAPARRTRGWVPVFSGLAVVAVLAGAVAFLGGSGGPTVTQWPVGAAPEAVTSLTRMAQLIEAQPETPKPGRYVRTEVAGWAGRCGGGNRCEIESQPRGWVYDLDTGEALASGGSRFELFGGQRAQGETPPSSQAGLGRPTRAWLDGLPTDPARLLDRLRAEVGENRSWSADHQVWDAVAQLYAYTEAALTPAQRAALLRALALIGGLTTRNLIVDGVHLVAVRHTEQTSGAEIIFNPGTARAVGRASASLIEGLSVVQADGGPTLPPGIIYQGTWEQEITSKA